MSDNTEQQQPSEDLVIVRDNPDGSRRVRITDRNNFVAITLSWDANGDVLIIDDDGERQLLDVREIAEIYKFSLERPAPSADAPDAVVADDASANPRHPQLEP